MRIIALATAYVIASGVIFLLGGQTAEALTPNTNNQTARFSTKTLALNQPTSNNPILSSINDEDAKKEEDEKPAQHIHMVVAGDNLSKISDQYGTKWVRLFNKNADIQHPDSISVGDKIVIPDPDEELEQRALPNQPVAQTKHISSSQQQTNSRSNQPAATSSNTTKVQRGTISGNRYSPGYCTWYVKNRRTDLPNNLGNANTWVARARAQGLPTGSIPRVGAVGQQGMHVVYVERVNNDGSVTVSEMNWRGLYVTSSRTVPANSFSYIY